MTSGTLPNPKHCLDDIKTTLHFRLLGGLSQETTDELIESNFEKYEDAFWPTKDAFLILLDSIDDYFENIGK